MRNTNNSPKIMASALDELGAELSRSDADCDGTVKIEGKDSVSLQGTTVEV